MGGSWLVLPKHLLKQSHKGSIFDLLATLTEFPAASANAAVRTKAGQHAKNRRLLMAYVRPTIGSLKTRK